MEGTLFILIVFGGGMLWLLSKTEIGCAIAHRIRGRSAGTRPDPAMVEELEQLRHEVAELAERMDFAERLLARQRDAASLPEGGPESLP